MKYLVNVKSFEDLKEQFKKLARVNHPDCGGDAEIMKIINQEYDQLFPIWKYRYNKVSQEPTTETADTTRSEFYTQNGWKGNKHDWSRTTKEVAALIRTYVKEVYPTYKFSVRYSHASMCSEIHIELKEAPHELYKTYDKLTEENIQDIHRKLRANHLFNQDSWYDHELKNAILESWDKSDFYKVYNDLTVSVIEDVDREVNNYNFHDCDGMTDYFHVDFYYFGCSVSYDFKIVEKAARIKNKTEQTKTTDFEEIESLENNLHYEIKEDTDTRDNSGIFVVKVIEKLEHEEYIKVNQYMKSIGGYYSKFKHGFIFKNNPNELLKGNIQQNTENQTNSKAQETAENITDYSTQVIEELGLKYPEYINNQDYISLLASKISHINIDNSIINCIEYDGLKQALRTISNSRKEQIEEEKKQAKKKKLIVKIKKQIESTQKKINGLSGDYKTNTWKRMNEQTNRESKIEGYQKDINILQYLVDTLETRLLTPLEENLIISSFRSEIDVYYRRNEAYNKPDRGTALTPIEFPKINYSIPLDGWWNKEVPKKQKRLQKANINNTSDLLKAVEEYKTIYIIINKPVNHKEKKIKQLEREYKMQQKGDINFTPSTVVKQLIEYARIDSNSKVLEPSAGIGNIADQIKQLASNLDVCEQMYHFCELLKLKGHNVVGNDFLEYNTDQKYDAIIMNPPFSDEINHIKHAYDLLKDGGTLVSISSPHWTFANDKKSVEFREWLENETYFTQDLQSGTFEMTGVTSKIIVIEKHEQAEDKTA